MLFNPLTRRSPGAQWLCSGICSAAIVGAASGAVAAPYVEFDFARAVSCQVVTPNSSANQFAHQRLVEVTLPISVRFHGLSGDDVDELDMEINGASSGLRVYDFSPTTHLASDLSQQIETTTTTKRARSLDATLGGSLPVPYAEIVAHVSPSINAGISGSEIATEKMNRLPPKHAVVVSGTASEGRGVFFKFKRTSQTSLEGVHPLSVTFVVPAGWQGGEVQVGCSARGRRKVFWIKQPATVGRAAGTVRIQLAGIAPPVYQVAKPVAFEHGENTSNGKSNPAAMIMAAAAEAIDLVDGAEPDSDTTKIVIENGATAGR